MLKTSINVQEPIVISTGKLFPAEPLTQSAPIRLPPSDDQERNHHPGVNQSITAQKGL